MILYCTIAAKLLYLQPLLDAAMLAAPERANLSALPSEQPDMAPLGSVMPFPPVGTTASSPADLPATMQVRASLASKHPTR